MFRVRCTRIWTATCRAASLTTGRHPLPSRSALADTSGRWGIDANVQVVAYDQGNGAFAARLWWLLRWAGHTNGRGAQRRLRRVAAGGSAGRATTRRRQPRSFAFRVARRRRSSVPPSSSAQLQAAGWLSSGERCLVDARAADRFAGQNETIDPVAGHIPGARNHPSRQSR